MTLHPTVAAVTARITERSRPTRQVYLAQVDAAANRVAAALLAGGLEPGQVVGVMLERSLELIISIIGVFRAGGACGVGAARASRRGHADAGAF